MSGSKPRGDTAGSWASEEYVAGWTAGDPLSDMLELPRRLSAALVADAGMEPGLVVDLGAGAGAYLGAMLERFPAAHGRWVDGSEPMRARARERLISAGDRVDYLLADLSRAEDLPLEEADVVVTSRAVHHFTPEVIRQMYEAVHRGLHPGGFFFNLDHFAVPPGWEERYRRIRPQFVPPRGDREPHGHDAPPQPLADHLGWLTTAGFEPPDVPWRAFWTALVGARKPG